MIDFFLYLGAGLFYLFWVLVVINWWRLTPQQRLESQDAWNKYRQDLQNIRKDRYDFTE